MTSLLLARREMTMPSYQKRRDRRWLRKAKALGRQLRKTRAGAGTAGVVAVDFRPADG